MSTQEATQTIGIYIFPPNMTGDCRQCGKPAVGAVTTELARTNACRDHMRLALDHFARAHGVK